MPTPMVLSPIFNSPSELRDVMSFIVHCKDDDTYILHHDGNLGYHLPYISQNQNDDDRSWGKLAKDWIKEYLELSPLNIEISLWRTVRVWNTMSNWLSNVIFYIPIDKAMKANSLKMKKNKTENKSGLRWLSLERIEELNTSHGKKELVSPDILTCIPISQGFDDQAMKIFENCAVVSNNFLVEVPRDYIITSQPNNLYDKMVENSAIKEIPELYSGYLQLTFPNILMGRKSFDRFANIFGWNEELTQLVFRGADLNFREGISFKEFLYMLCILNSNTKPSKYLSEARARFIFRCFDTERKGVLSEEQFRQLTIKINNLSEVQTALVEEYVENNMRTLNLARETGVTLHNFLQATSTNSIEINQAFSSHINLITSFCNNSKRKSTSRHDENIEGGLKKTEDPFGKGDRGEETDFTLSYHLAKISGGKLIECPDFETEQDVWSEPLPAAREGHEPSVDNFNPIMPYNQVLNMLRYFSSPVEDIKQEVEDECSIETKQCYEWLNEEKFNTFKSNLESVSTEVTMIFKSEPRLLDLTSPLYVFGDFHGNIRDVTCFSESLWPLGLGLFGGKLLFLGDYVDRGQNGLEVVAYLFALKVRYPNQIYLIRGNHEIRYLQKRYTFHSELIKRCGSQDGQNLWALINDAFDCMPLAATIDGQLFCCHGGIPPPWCCPTISFIQNIPHCLQEPETNATAWSLLWNDPVKESNITENLEMELSVNNGFAKNYKRGTGFVFNTDALENFLKVNNLSYVIRAHEVQQHGYQIHHKGKIITLFSSSNYTGKNQAACLFIKEKKLKLIQIDTSEFQKTEKINKI